MTLFSLALAVPSVFAGDKALLEQNVHRLADEITSAKEVGASLTQIQALQAQYLALTSQLNGWDPMCVMPTAVVPPPEAPAATPPGATASTTSGANVVSTPISDNQSNASTLVIAGAGNAIWDVDLTTNITHTWTADLNITLTSPAGTTVTVSTANGGSNDNVFDGTLFDDQTTTPASDAIYVDGATASPLTPEGAFGAFRGEDPNGVWTLDCADGATGDVGAFTWSLDVTTLDATPTNATSSHGPAAALPIADNQSNASTILVSGLDGFICDVDVTTFITHTWNSDLNITLTSPAGTQVTVSSLNGGSNDDVFDGTLFDDQALIPATDNVYADGVTAAHLAPEGALGAFIGEDPNGAWILDCQDNATGDVGEFSWSLDITTCQVAECFLVIGSGAGTATFLPQDHVFDTLVNDVQSFYPVLLDDIPSFVLPSAWFAAAEAGVVGGNTNLVEWEGDAPVFAVQVLMWNPSMLPEQPEQWTHGLLVKVLPDGSIVSRPYGQGTGMQVWAETKVNAKGQHVISFPFSIPGF